MNFKKGILGNKFAPDQAYIAQINKVIAMLSVMTFGFIKPFSDINAIDSPAPKKRYQLGPPTITAMCKIAAKKLNEPAIIRAFNSIRDISYVYIHNEAVEKSIFRYHANYEQA